MTTAQLEEFAKRLRRFRMRYNISQQDFCKIAGITQPTLSNIENCNYKPTFRTIAKIEVALQKIKRQAEKVNEMTEPELEAFIKKE